MTTTSKSGLQKFSEFENGNINSARNFGVEGNDLCFGFKKNEILNNLNITVQRGIIYGLLGPSGCGKTTLLRCIVGRHKPKSGSIKIFGKTPGQKGFSIPGPGVGFMPQELALYPDITTWETLMYFGRIYLLSDKDIEERINFLTDILEIPNKNKQIKELSGGQQRRVSLAAALIHKPPLIILDEPTVGVDPLLRKSIWNYMQNLASADFLTIIITTHYVEEARQAHTVGLMRDGHILAEANPEHLLQKYAVTTLEDVFLNLCVKSENTNSAENQVNTDLQTEEFYSCHLDQDAVPRTQLQNINRSVDSLRVLDVEDTWSHSMKTSVVRTNAHITKNFIRLKRNLLFLFIQIFAPAFQIILFCLCIGKEPYNLPLAVVNLEPSLSGKSQFFLDHINPRTIKQVPYSNVTLALESVQRGENWGLIYIKPNFTRGLRQRYLQGIYADNKTLLDSTISLHFDMTDHQITMTMLTKILGGYKDFSEDIMKESYQNPLLAEQPIVIADPVYGDKTPDFTEFMAPGSILGGVYVSAIALSAISIIIEKREGLLDRSLIAGVRSWEVLFSIFFTLFIVMLFQVAFVLLFPFFVFNISSSGSFVWITICVLLAGLQGMVFGLFLSAITNNENIALMITLGSFYPNMLLGGIIWPIEAMPTFLRQFSYGLPLTLLTETMRSILSRGWSITEYGIWNGCVVALVWIVPLLIISSFIFKYKK